MGAAQTTVLLPRQVWGNNKGICGEGSPTTPRPEDIGTTGRTQDTWELVPHTPAPAPLSPRPPGCPKAQALELVPVNALL